MMFPNRIRAAHAAVALVTLAAGAAAPTPAARAQTVDATDRGWYDSTGGYTGIDNYIAGDANDSQGRLYRNWFLFAVPAPGAGQQYVGATLRLFMPGAPIPGYNSADPTETYQVVDYTGSLTDLVTNNGNGNGLAIYNDLGTGTVYATLVASAALDGTFVDIPLNASALAAINAAAGKSFALGGFVSTLDAVTNNEYVFGRTGGAFGRPASDSQLVLTQGTISSAAPEPASLALLALPALPLVGQAARRRK